jgi:hypothetical protein
MQGDLAKSGDRYKASGGRAGFVMRQPIIQHLCQGTRRYPPVDSCRLLVYAEVTAEAYNLHVWERLLHESQSHFCALQSNSNRTP